jgi:hypothetical protein
MVIGEFDEVGGGWPCGFGDVEGGLVWRVVKTSIEVCFILGFVAAVGLGIFEVA